MQHLLDTTELLVASWVLAGDGDHIPMSHGILDRALQTVVEKEAYPQWLRNQLHFADSRIGLQCVELPSLLNWAQRAQLTAAPNLSDQSAQVQVQISPRVARRILPELDVTEEEAIAWGKTLREAVTQATKSIEDYPDGTVEEY